MGRYCVQNTYLRRYHHPGDVLEVDYIWAASTVDVCSSSIQCCDHLGSGFCQGMQGALGTSGSTGGAWFWGFLFSDPAPPPSAYLYKGTVLTLLFILFGFEQASCI
ncbi:hypothetical protein ATANTOWER_028406 [Ataeniobius toweri]|uniref:Uncharacterized protein n=1 Tax=Ataeniobius toweri TaxID=208326 RepID=A0ABU7A9W0_9TELE|nr:hypothetical protein [Ataeniobius toweri]